MTTTPAGRPAWEHANDFTSYGGHATKRDYQNIPVINPKTDVSAAAICRLAADVAAIQRVASFAVIEFAPADPSHPTVNYVRMMTGVTSTPYTGNAPPTGYPSIAYVSTGVYTVTFSSSYLDPFGVSGDLDLQFCHVTAAEISLSAASGTACERVNAYTWTIRVFTSSTGAPATVDAVHLEFA